MSDTKGDKKTFVEEGTQFKGTMTSSCWNGPSHPEDAAQTRSAVVSLTPAGRKLHDRVFPRVLAIHHALLAPFSAAEVTQMARLLHRLRRRAIELQAGKGAVKAAR